MMNSRLMRMPTMAPSGRPQRRESPGDSDVEMIVWLLRNRLCRSCVGDTGVGLVGHGSRRGLRNRGFHSGMPGGARALPVPTSILADAEGRLEALEVSGRKRQAGQVDDALQVDGEVAGNLYPHRRLPLEHSA